MVYHTYVFDEIFVEPEFGQEVAKKWPKNWVPGFFQHFMVQTIRKNLYQPMLQICRKEHVRGP